MQTLSSLTFFVSCYNIYQHVLYIEFYLTVLLMLLSDVSIKPILVYSAFHHIYISMHFIQSR